MVSDTPAPYGHGFCQISASYTHDAKVRQASGPGAPTMGIILDLYCVQKRKPLVRDRTHPVTFRLSHVRASRYFGGANDVTVDFPRAFAVFINHWYNGSREDQKRIAAVSQAFQTRELVLTVTEADFTPGHPFFPRFMTLWAR